jgi:hypothetical protein
MTRKWLMIGVAVLAGFALTIGVAYSGSAPPLSSEALARSTAREFFQTINARRFDRTCNLMSARFYRENHMPDRARCVLALRIEFTWAPSFNFSIRGVRFEGDRAIVTALANRAPGRVVLVEEAGRLKVLSVRGS